MARRHPTEAGAYTVDESKFTLYFFHISILLQYEDMVGDLNSAVVKVAAFLGGNCEKVVSNAHDLARVSSSKNK